MAAPVLKTPAGVSSSATIDPPDDRLISIREVCRLTSLSKTTIYNMIGAGTFPTPARVGSAARREGGELNRWSVIEVRAWIAERLAARRERP